MPYRHKMQRIAVVLAVLAVFASCHRADEHRTKLRVGLITGTSGPTAAWGEAIRRGAQLAADEARDVELLVVDDQGKPEQAAVAAERLITSDNVAAIIGCDTSGRSLAAAPIVERYGVAMVTPTASAPAVTQNKRFVFRVCTTDDHEAMAAAHLALRTLHAKRIAILRDTRNDYSVGMTETLVREAGNAVVGTFDYAEGDSDFRAQLTAAAALHPDVLFVPGYYGDVAQLATQSRDLGITVPLVGGSGWDSPKLVEIGGNAVEGCWFVSGRRSASPHFVDAFRKRYGTDPDAANAQAYDAMTIVSAAARTSRGDRTKLRDVIAATHVDGASGAITIGPDHNAKKALGVFHVEHGKFIERGVVE